MQAAKKEVSRKASVFFFAEGSRSRNGKVMPFKKGAFIFACETDLPILPVTIKNSFHILPSDSLDLTPGVVDIIVHHPVYVSGHHPDRLDEMINQIRKTIAGKI